MATEDNYLVELMNRVVAIQLESLADYDIAAKPFFFWWQEDPPYMINRLGRNEPTGVSEDMNTDVYFVQMRLIVGHLTEGVPGEMDERFYTFVPLLQNKFARNKQLISALYPNEMDILSPLGASIVSFTGLTVFYPNLGFKTHHIGCEWTLRCPFTISIEQEY